MLTNHIFEGPLKHKILQEDVHNQRIRLSKEPAWKVMWLATRLFACSQRLMKDLTQFHGSAHNPIEVKQTRDPNYPELLLIVINKQGSVGYTHMLS